MTTNDSTSSPRPSNAPVEERNEDGKDTTTLQVRRAVAGDAESIAWVIERFGPALIEQARFRMPRLLASAYSIEDVVQDVWIRVLPRLGTLESRGKGMTQGLLRYFSTALVNRINELARRHARGERLERTKTVDSNLSRLVADTTGVHSRVLRGESADILHRTLEALEPLDREVLILRGIEQHTNEEAAQLIGESPNTVSHRFARALERLRERLPNSFVDDLGD